MDKTQPLLSIVMLTYNHAPYIEQAMESCLSQETSFPFELIVCDDASTDGTTEIVEKWAEKHDNLVFLQQPLNNHGINNFMDGLGYVRSKYIAFCEGDDYWTSPHKLEKQVRYLEENPDFSGSCHKVELKFENRPGDEKKQYIYKDCSADDERIRQGIFYADEAIANYYFQTSSYVFRWRFRDGLPHWFRKWMLYDHALMMLHAVEGKIKYFDEAMSVWRRNETGYSWLQNVDKGVFFQKEGFGWIKFYQEMDDFFAGRFHLQIRERVLLALRNMVSNCLETGDLVAAKRIIELNENWCLPLIKDNRSLFDAVQQAFPEQITRIPPWASQSKTAAEAPTLGGFKALDIESIPECPDSVWSQWTQGQEAACFTTPLAALVAWIYHRRVRMLWLPAIFPQALLNELNCLSTKYRTYPVGARLSPGPEFIAQTQPGDAVLTYSWAGRPPSPELRNALMARRSGVLWIDDRSSALWTDTPHEADVTLYSPSDVLGVPDGGILVGAGVASLPIPSGKNTLAPLRSQLVLERLEQPAVGSDQLIQEQALHAQHPLPGGSMSRLSAAMLTRIPLHPLAKRCRDNWQILYKNLSKYTLWPECATVDFTPSAFPILTPPSIPLAFFLTALQRKGIVSQGFQLSFKNEGGLGEQRELLQRLLYLPCDHRYNECDMEYLSTEILKIIHGKSDLGLSGTRRLL